MSSVIETKLNKIFPDKNEFRVANRNRIQAQSYISIRGGSEQTKHGNLSRL